MICYMVFKHHIRYYYMINEKYNIKYDFVRLT